ncbi:hypothetical protein QBC38DRAFT_375408 [Podospora fimiseda]|uniref:Rhodopsin domain-containing protein n=1 Tax=Podospora fimiseda TaxID=252190 RepID=A0AAN7BFJ5_9PEZI|nr:hypothetical protein QBC38DRAFT_375408 [Podospora fimiseda]
MATAQPPPVDPTNPGIGAIIYGISWTFTIIAIATVAARFYVRRAFVRMVPEDWIMLLALAIQILYQTILHIMCDNGLGKAAGNITAAELLITRRWMWISSPIANAVSIIARLSITVLLIRIFGATHLWFKVFMVIWAVLMVVLGILSPIFLFAQVTPVAALWDVGVKGVYRFTPYVQYYTSFTLQLVFTISDLTYVLFPVCILWNMNMPLHRKVGLILLMSMSLITMGAALVKVALVIIQLTTPPKVGSKNLAYFNGIYNLCTGVEQCLVIIMGCIPPLRSITRIPMPAVLVAIGSSLVSLVPRIRSSRSSRSSVGRNGRVGSAEKVQVVQEIVVVDSKGLSGDDDSEGGKRGGRKVSVESEGEKSSVRGGRGGGIQRVDGYSVTWQNRRREDV